MVHQFALNQYHLWEQWWVNKNQHGRIWQKGKGWKEASCVSTESKTLETETGTLKTETTAIWRRNWNEWKSSSAYHTGSANYQRIRTTEYPIIVKKSLVNHFVAEFTMLGWMISGKEALDNMERNYFLQNKKTDTEIQSFEIMDF